MWKPAQSFETVASHSGKADEEEEEEDDYMSDAFLSQCTSSRTDVRPGLPMTYSMKRQLEIDKKKKAERLARLSVRTKTQQERLDEGLNTALGEGNKGFSMLQKMGYKPGCSLGKEGGNGRVEPIKVEVKQGRGGLGLKEMLMERKREKERRYLAKIKKHNLEFDPLKFREQKRQQLLAKQLEADLRRCQRACHRLDSEQDVTEPMEWYFWPDYLLPQPDEEEEAEEGQPHDLQHKTQTKEDSGGGFSDEEHSDLLKPGAAAATVAGVPNGQEQEPWQTEIHVDVVSTYLRNAYLYCIWCGTAYHDLQDMESTCPGPNKQDHDDE